MSADTELHPTADALRQYGLGLVRDPERSRIEEHISKCSTCCDVLQNVDADTLVELARDAQATPAPLDTVVHPDLPAELVDHPRYRILQALGEGGMGTVFKAEHKVMGRTVALKVINRKLMARSEIVERFRTEVKAAAQLAHPNIVTAHDAEEANGLHFLVMEYVEGFSLDRYVARRGPLPPNLACQLIRQAALGLQHAHEKGMVHRDIKPHNLMITRKGQVKILDFGLARLAQDAGALNTTAPNLVLGTPDFLAPEQARNSHMVDIRADLYALGCTLYFMLTGRTPFGGDNVYEKLIAHTTAEAEPITSYRTDVPASVEAIVYKLLSKKPEDRFSTPAELATALAAAAKMPADASAPMPPVPVVKAPVDINATTVLLPKEPAADSSRRARRRKKKSGLPLVPLVAAVALPLLLLVSLVAVWQFGLKRKDADPQPTKLVGGATQKQPTVNPSPGKTPSTTVGGRTNTVLIIVPQTGLWWKDYEPVRSTIEIKSGLKVIAASYSLRPFELAANSRNDRYQGTEKADEMLDSALDASRYDGVILVGANVDAFLPGRPLGSRIKSFLEEMLAQNKIVGGICLGQKVLAFHGLLDGKRAAKPDHYSLFGREFNDVKWTTSERVVKDGQIVTASADSDYLTFVQSFCRPILMGRPK